MKYFIRSIKYFFYFAFLTTAIVLALILIGAVEGGINDIFEGGYNALWKIAIFFAAVAAVYPKFGFVQKIIETNQDWAIVKGEATRYFGEKSYKIETESQDEVTFRRRDIIGRITKMGEDRISLQKRDNGFVLEGLRKDVYMYANGLEYTLRDTPEHN